MLTLKNATKTALLEMYAWVLRKDPNVDEEHFQAFTNAAEEATVEQLYSVLIERAAWDSDCAEAVKRYPKVAEERKSTMNTKNTTATKTTKTVSKKEGTTMTKKNIETKKNTKTVAPKAVEKKVAETKTVNLREVVENYLKEQGLAFTFTDKLNRTNVQDSKGLIIWRIEYKRAGISIRTKMDMVPGAYVDKVVYLPGKPTAPECLKVAGEDVLAVLKDYTEWSKTALDTREALKAAKAEEKEKAQAEKKAARDAEKKAQAEVKAAEKAQAAK